MPDFRLFQIEEDFTHEHTEYPLTKREWETLQSYTLPVHGHVHVARMTRIYEVRSLHRGLVESDMIAALNLEVGEGFQVHAGKTVTRLQ